MNSRDFLLNAMPIPDVQSKADDRALPIEAVGIRGVRYPLILRTASGNQSTVAEFALDVALPAEQKGTHMSRFVALLEEHRNPIGAEDFGVLVQDMLVKLEAQSGSISTRFAFFVEKAAPVSGVKSLLDMDVVLAARGTAEAVQTTLKVIVPVTSLCPCSKEISEYGAHNQRSHVTIEAELAGALTIEQLVRVAEESASAELYGLLKRVDEKFVTEAAYDNPKFVEDLVRDVVRRLQVLPGVGAFSVEVENFESIHNHSAYARISGIGPGK
jgi:GTP cyclohydrolase I